jgi:hypothetical protein
MPLPNRTLQAMGRRVLDQLGGNGAWTQARQLDSHLREKVSVPCRARRDVLIDEPRDALEQRLQRRVIGVEVYARPGARSGIETEPLQGVRVKLQISSWRASSARASTRATRATASSIRVSSAALTPDSTTSTSLRSPNPPHTRLPMSHARAPEGRSARSCDSTSVLISAARLSRSARARRPRSRNWRADSSTLGGMTQRPTFSTRRPGRTAARRNPHPCRPIASRPADSAASTRRRVSFRCGGRRRRCCTGRLCSGRRVR